MFTPVAIGERLIVQGITYATATVCAVEFIDAENRWMIHLDWGEFGQSKVYSTDENKVWFRFSKAN